MKIGDRIFVRGYIDEIRKDTVIVRNDGGYFGTTWNEVTPSEQSEPQRTFVELVVEYPDPELRTYKEYKGKPYYSIKYIENGETYIGYGTYNPKVLSRYLSEYFISSAQPERKKGKWIRNDTGTYSCSVCHSWIPEEQHHYARYCLYCGVAMRGEVNENQNS